MIGDDYAHLNMRYLNVDTDLLYYTCETPYVMRKIVTMMHMI